MKETHDDAIQNRVRFDHGSLQQQWISSVYCYFNSGSSSTSNPILLSVCLCSSPCTSGQQIHPVYVVGGRYGKAYTRLVDHSNTDIRILLKPLCPSTGQETLHRTIGGWPLPVKQSDRRMVEGWRGPLASPMVRLSGRYPTQVLYGAQLAAMLFAEMYCL